jgi:hypothetical protein
MSAVAIDRHQRVELIANEIATALQANYPFITTEIIYDPPGGVSAWVRVEGAADADQLDDITSSVLDIQLAALEREGILVLAL